MQDQCIYPSEIIPVHLPLPQGCHGYKKRMDWGRPSKKWTREGL